MEDRDEELVRRLIAAGMELERKRGDQIKLPRYTVIMPGFTKTDLEFLTSLNISTKEMFHE